MKDPRVKKPRSRPQKSKAPAPQHSTDNAEIPSRLGRRKRRRRNKRGVTEKEGLRISPQPQGSIVSALAKKRAKKTAPTVKTQARSPVETVAKSDTTLTSALNHPSQKTSVSFGKLCVGD